MLWRDERRARYHFAARLVAGRDVLDIVTTRPSCATILRQSGARSVAVQAGRGDAMGRAPLPVYLSGGELPVRSGAFGVVTCFEQFGYLEDARPFVDECRRVLSEDGVLVASAAHASRRCTRSGETIDPTVRRYDVAHLTALLRPQFGEVELLGQRVSPSLPPCPFWDRPDEVEGLSQRFFVARWWAMTMLPLAISDRATRLFHNRAFFPTEYDYAFRPEFLERSHVIVAVCRR
ncbi:MAG: methyltransferase domain-containing protein [Acidimicrobiales bacterium]|jgi:SAM-dependent methyltransferase